MLRNFQTKNFIMVKNCQSAGQIKADGGTKFLYETTTFFFPFWKIELVPFIVSLNVMNFYRKFLWRNSISWPKRLLLTWLIFLLSHTFYFIKFSERNFYWTNYLPVTTGCARDCDLHGQKYLTSNFLGFFGFVKTIKLLIIWKKIKTQAQSHS